VLHVEVESARATPGHDCFGLNVMAVPTGAWNYRMDPNYAHPIDWQ
jgi:5-deoxy-D-glucuronate isomerase